MPDDARSDAVEKFLNEQKSMEDRKQALIADLLKQKEAASKDFDQKKQAAMKDFDDKLAKLGHHSNSSGRAKRSHHKKQPASAEGRPKQTAKP
jgi:hypothetical protein